jgi:hypothetical protein
VGICTLPVTTNASNKAATLDIIAAAQKFGGAFHVPIASSTAQVLVALDERTHELGRDQFYALFRRCQLASHVARTGTGFRDDGARLQSSEGLDQLLATYLPVEHGFAMPILSVKVKRVLAQINPNERDFLHDGFSVS